MKNKKDFQMIGSGTSRWKDVVDCDGEPDMRKIICCPDTFPPSCQDRQEYEATTQNSFGVPGSIEEDNILIATYNANSFINQKRKQ